MSRPSRFGVHDHRTFRLTLLAKVDRNHRASVATGQRARKSLGFVDVAESGVGHCRQRCRVGGGVLTDMDRLLALGKDGAGDM